MSVGISIPKRPQDSSGKLLSLAGAGVGAIVGGPAGAGMGMQLGGIAAGLKSGQEQGPQALDTSALSRRQAQLSDQPLMQIRNSIDSLKYIEDPAARVELAKPLLQADFMARGKNSIG